MADRTTAESLDLLAAAAPDHWTLLGVLMRLLPDDQKTKEEAAR